MDVNPDNIGKSVFTQKDILPLRGGEDAASQECLQMAVRILEDMNPLLRAAVLSVAPKGDEVGRVDRNDPDRVYQTDFPFCLRWFSRSPKGEHLELGSQLYFPGIGLYMITLELLGYEVSFIPDDTLSDSSLLIEKLLVDKARVLRKQIEGELYLRVTRTPVSSIELLLEQAKTGKASGKNCINSNADSILEHAVDLGDGMTILHSRGRISTDTTEISIYIMCIEQEDLFKWRWLYTTTS